ncbi:protein FAR1-RELATED SEQUENCE 2-like [Papaver somniferum]|uniref:protein FAR1-RELATED SEQUENCE 2-like n=1 Tax=Papaver somniferum TaxID=3469 RepID=UPI000E6FB2FA|nr:protein FAR1-RELATED SEQUENCE 2-like [Papaver somniferum]
MRFKSKEIERGDDFNTHLVTSKIGFTQRFTVKIKPVTHEGYCECQYFEFKGLPCKHVLKVLMKLEVDEIPPHFILKRWLKGDNSFRIINETSLSQNYENSEIFRLSHLCRRSTQLSCLASKSDELYKMAIAGIENIFAQIVDEHNKSVEDRKTTSTSSSKIQEATEIETIGQPIVGDPHISQVKGRPRDKKKKSQ